MRPLTTGIILFLAAGPAFAEAPLAEKYLQQAQLTEGIAALNKHLEQAPKDDQARFGLGLLQFVQGIEHLSQNLHRYGLREHQALGNLLPVLRLPVPANRDPERLGYKEFRGIFQAFLDDLTAAEASFGLVADEAVTLPIHVGKIQIDRTGKGRIDNLFAIMAVMGVQPRWSDRDFLVCFDRGDACWFRGYCHLLSAMCEFVLAHDLQELFEATGHLFFEKVKSPHEFLQTGRRVWDFGNNVDIVDLIAFIHLIRMPVQEPARMKKALTHLETMLAQSKLMWKYVLAETDDDHEWIPNPRQTGVLRVPVTQAMIDSWLGFVAEAEEILQGTRLIPFWRARDAEQGVNLRRAFTEPRPFDLVLWIQGTAATPYLEKGPMTRPQVWDRLSRVFRGEFFGFALWFN
jgi:ribosomal protein S15P/S13E